MAEVIYIFQFLVSIALLAVGVSIRYGLCWGLITAGAALFLSCGFQRVSAHVVNVRVAEIVNGGDNASMG